MLVFGRNAPDAAPDRIITLDRRTGAVSYLTADPEQDVATVAAELHEASNALSALAPADTAVGPRDFVNANNACFIKMASITVLAVGAVIAAPFVIEGIAIAATEAAATIAEKGVQGFAVQAARTAWASQKFRRLLAFHVVKSSLKAWLLFSDKGKDLTAPVRRQLHQVVHAKCTPPSSEAVTFGGM